MGYCFDYIPELLRKNTMMPQAAIGNSSQSEYPPEEWRISRQLVRMIASAPTWQNVIEASDALFHVEFMAKALRDDAARQK